MNGAIQPRWPIMRHRSPPVAFMTRLLSSTLPLLAALLAGCAAVPARAAAKPAEQATPCTRTAVPGDDLQAAIDGLPAQRRATLCLQSGHYELAGLLAIRRDGITLRGTGTDTVLQLRDGVQQPLLVIGDYANEVPSAPIRNVVVENLHLIGNHAAHEFMPEHPYLSNSAVVVRGGHDVDLRQIVVERCRSACLLSERDTQGLAITDSDVSGATWDGVSFNRSSHVTMSGNHVHDNAAAGITTEHLEDSDIRDNVFERNGSQGLYLSDSRDNRFVGNRFVGNTRAGVFLTCSIRYRTPEVLCWDNSMSQDNVFEHNVFEGSPYTFTIGVDRAADCKAADFKPNLWRDNQADASGFNPPKDVYGTCVDTGRS